MRASDLILAAVAVIENSTSPYSTALAGQLRELYVPALYHEKSLRAQVTNGTGPRETALGHKPKGITVEGKSVQTDQALECLSGSD